MYCFTCPRGTTWDCTCCLGNVSCNSSRIHICYPLRDSQGEVFQMSGKYHLKTRKKNMYALPANPTIHPLKKGNNATKPCLFLQHLTHLFQYLPLSHVGIRLNSGAFFKDDHWPFLWPAGVLLPEVPREVECTPDFAGDSVEIPVNIGKTWYWYCWWKKSCTSW